MRSHSKTHESQRPSAQTGRYRELLIMFHILLKKEMLKTLSATISFSTSKGHKRGVLQLPEQTGPRRAEWEGDYRDSVGGGRWAFVSLLIGDLVSDMSRKGPKSIVRGGVWQINS